MLDNQSLLLSDESHASNVGMYLLDEDDDGDNVRLFFKTVVRNLEIELITLDMIKSIKDHREENREMFKSINEAIQLMLVIATNIRYLVKNDKDKEGCSDNFRDKDS
ncbi:hypothetical protein Tco_1312408 [Tanacetum coccineum]